MNANAASSLLDQATVTSIVRSIIMSIAVLPFRCRPNSEQTLERLLTC